MISKGTIFTNHWYENNSNMREEYFQEIITKHRDKIYRICLAYLYEKELVDDLFQEVLINIWNGLKNFKGNAKLTTWLYRVTLNTTITFNRANTKHRKLFQHELPKHIAEDVKKQPETIDKNVQKLMRCVNELKKEERLIISLVLEELSYKEIAEIIGIAPNSVGVRINRIKKRLLKIYNHA